MEKWKLRAIRANLNLTLEDVQKATGIAPRTLSRWERGECLPNLSKLKKLLEFYGVSIDQVDI